MRLHELPRLPDLSGVQPHDAYVLEWVWGLGGLQRRLLQCGHGAVCAGNRERELRDWRGDVQRLHRLVAWNGVPIEWFLWVQRSGRLSRRDGLQHHDASVHRRLRGRLGLRRGLL